ncbi:hypothetical protein LZQ00_06400 [Sphingobacterium sp. SRCM116780]|uniref:hypothetical protein n=1 Tax=Sphingobacterium sp. SRCM116780 TaxID=2907623 RepID=UPI001F473A58|nr:hypothetical protein [Sphingobacterium sp. SRCM116780]UIR57445.1 hypothetical protein LZQ00_06400 [Sphingobacterium sp. SRCM116780]
MGRCFSRIIGYTFFKYVFTIGLFFLLGEVCANGLRINGNSYPINKRSAAEISFSQISDIESFENGNFQLSFHLALDEKSNQGGIFKLKFAGSDQVISMNLKDTHDDKIEFSLNLEGISGLGHFVFDKSQLKIQQWFPIALHIDLIKKSLTWKVMDKSVILPEIIGFKNKAIPQELIFGKHGYVIDVADFTIKDLQLSNGHLQCRIPLKEREGNVIHDNQGKVIGKVTNPNWLARESFFWEKWKTVNLKSVGGYQMDQERGRLVVFSQDSIRLIDLYSGKETVSPMPANLPFQIQLGNSFLLDNKLYIYEVNNLAEGICSIVQVDLDNPHLVCMSKHQLPMQLHHHTGQVLSQMDYMIFGGFGNERYNGHFLKLNIKTGIWDTLSTTGDRIHPRYFTSSFIDRSNNFYIFAGMGNAQGDNNLGRSYYYDLYQLDLKSRVVKKMWQLTWKDKNKVPVRQLVYDGKRNFYGLMYAEYESSSFLHLYQFSIDKPNYQVLADSIPIKSDKIKTNANLFQFEPLNRLYAVTEVYDNEEVKSEIIIYRLRLPVLTRTAWEMEQDQKKLNVLPWVIVSVVLIVYGLYWGLKKRNTSESNSVSKYSDHLPFTEVTSSKSSYGELILEDNFLFPSKNCIHFFGDFQVIDAKGVDITHLFKGKVKHLFILILLHDPNRGIRSEMISNLLWPDKEHTVSKNIRGVTLNHLRKSLEYLEGIKLNYTQPYYKIELDGTYLDSYRFKEMIDQGKMTNELWTILNRGQFLSKESADGLDTLKSQNEQHLIEFLMQEIQRACSLNELKMALQLIQILYLTDPVSTEALKIEIGIWQHMHEETKAKKSYRKFQKRYLKWMGSDYIVPFESLFNKD